MGERLPTILSKGMDDTIKTLNEQSDEDLIVDLIGCLDRMDKLMSDLSTVALIRPIIDDGTDTALWNKVCLPISSFDERDDQLMVSSARRSLSTFREKTL